MSGESRNWRLLLGGATLTFLVTLATFFSSVATVRAQNCFADGMNGIGPNCWDECQQGGYAWGTCANCAATMCGLLATPAPPDPYDQQCYDTCVAGAANSGCGEYCPGG